MIYRVGVQKPEFEKLVYRVVHALQSLYAPTEAISCDELQGLAVVALLRPGRHVFLRDKLQRGMVVSYYAVYFPRKLQKLLLGAFKAFYFSLGQKIELEILRQGGVQLAYFAFFEAFCNFENYVGRKAEIACPFFIGASVLEFDFAP